MAEDNQASKMFEAGIGGLNQLFAKFWIIAFVVVVSAAICVGIGAGLGVEPTSVAIFVGCAFAVFIIAVLAIVSLQRSKQNGTAATSPMRLVVVARRNGSRAKRYALTT